MKKLPRIFSILLSMMVLFTVFQNCSNKTKDSSKHPVALSETEITEAKLPPGKQVIEEEAKSINKTGEVSALESNKPAYEAQSEDPLPAESRSDLLKKKYKNLLVFHADDTMEVNKPKLAVLILARDESVEKMKVQVLEESEARDEKIKYDTTMEFGSKMRARLIPFSGTKLDFHIEELGDDEQSFRSNRKKILWQWKITPLKEGQHELKLSVQIIEKDGEAVSLAARNIPVVIFAKQEGFMSRVGNFFATKYEWIITAIFLPLLIAWITSRIRNRNNRQTQGQPENKVS